MKYAHARTPNYDAACFFAQQCVEKYLKARLVEADIYFKKVHDLTYLLGLCALKPCQVRSRKSPDFRAKSGDFAVRADNLCVHTLGLVADVEPLWTGYEQEFRLLTDYAVEFRYPGASADLELAKSALKICKSFRKTVRHSLRILD